jgi:hypothetical protein
VVCRAAVQHACPVITITCWASLVSPLELEWNALYSDSWHFSAHPFLHLFLADNLMWSSVFSASHRLLVVVIFQLQRAKPQWWLILAKISWASNVLSTSVGNKMIMLSLYWVTCYCTWITVSCCISKLQYSCIIWNTSLQYSSVLQYCRVKCVCHYCVVDKRCAGQYIQLDLFCAPHCSGFFLHAQLSSWCS